jgi:dienelactone hydrolase
MRLSCLVVLTIASLLLLSRAFARDARDTIEQSIQIPIDDGSGQQVMMQGHLCRPRGVDKPQLVIINHGSPPNSSDRPGMKVTACDSEAVQWFVQRNYAVVAVLRLGYGATGGPWTEGYAGCENADYYKAGLETGRQIGAMVDFATALPNVTPNNVIVVGQSAGGWGTIAYSGMPHPKVFAFINMAGGRGGHHHDRPNSNCKSDRLVAAAGEYGKTSRTPMLWVYTGNDTFFGPPIAEAMFQTFQAAGGQAQLIRPDEFGRDGHQLFFGRGGSAIWGPIVDVYLSNMKRATPAS